MTYNPKTTSFNNLANNQICFSDWARTSEGASQWATDMSGMLSDMFDYMTEDEMPADQAADLLFGMLRRVVDAKITTKYNQPETIPSSPNALASRQR